MDPINQERPAFPAQAGEGYLIVHVTTARGAIPLEGAQVTVRDASEDFRENRGDAIAVLISGRDGNTERIALPAPPAKDSLSPGASAPFETYNLEVHLEGYRGQIYYALPIFTGITAIQPVDMIPLPENGNAAAFDPRENRFYESTPPIL